ncbi:MAG: rubrerythrin family protein [Clostridia bacterium]|nr:rubrerythrin family protein [Clostridia bacterium]
MEKEASRTARNVQSALSQELRNASAYRLYARSARDEGYLQIADLFSETAQNELEHASLLWELSAQCRTASTAENLAAALEAETHSGYETYAAEAEAEGLPETAYLFRQLLGVEKNHARRFRILAENLRTGAAFQKEQDCYWICRVCGALHRSRTAPQTCPVCGYPQSCFSLYAEDF